MRSPSCQKKINSIFNECANFFRDSMFAVVNAIQNSFLKVGELFLDIRILTLANSTMSLCYFQKILIFFRFMATQWSRCNRLRLPFPLLMTQKVEIWERAVARRFNFFSFFLLKRSSQCVCSHNILTRKFIRMLHRVSSLETDVVQLVRVNCIIK